MIRKIARFWGVVLFLGGCFDWLFWESAIGVNAAVFAVLGLAGAYVILAGEGRRPARDSLWLVIPAVAFPALTFLRCEPLTVLLASVFTAVSIGLLSVTYAGGGWMRYGLADYAGRFTALIAGTLTGAASFLRATHREQAGQDRPGIPFPAVLRGLLIALPVVVCFASLLASADVIFSQKLDELFGGDRIGEYLTRLFRMLVVAYGLAGVILHAASRRQEETLRGADRPLVMPFLGFTESAIVLGGVAALFLSFVMIQFGYFFGGESNIGVQGFTYSQYARRGFSELIWVAFLSLVLMLGLSAVSRREGRLQQRAFAILNAAVVAQVMVMLVSAYQRLSLAIDWHGFSRLRLYPRVFMIWLGILLAAVVVLEILNRQRAFAFAALLAALGFAVSLMLVNVDEAIVRHNLERAREGKYLNVAHLVSLSTDAVPALVEEFRSPSLSVEAREALGAALLCRMREEHTPAQPGNDDWRSFNLSVWQAEQALKSVQADLEEYRLNSMFARVRTPGGALIECLE